MKILAKIHWLAITSLFVLSSAGIAQQNARLTSSVFSMGFARPVAQNTIATSIIGQPFVASSVSQGARIESGFLANTFFRSPAFFIEIIIDDTLAIGVDSELTLSNPAGFFPVSRQLFFRRGGETSYQSQELPAGDQYRISFPADYVTERGVEYYLSLSDGSLNITFPTENAAENPAIARVGVDSLSTPYALGEHQHRMISVPVELESGDLFAMLGDDLGEYNIFIWRLFQFRDGEYVEYPNIEAELQPGQAFWLIGRFGGGVDIQNALSTDSGEDFEITLQPGWNQIANPFAFPVAWDQVATDPAVEAPVFFDGTEDIPGVSVIQPWEGYWVFNGAASASSILVPAIESIEADDNTVAGIVIDPETEYRLQLSATDAAGQVDRHNYLGMRNAASGDHDHLDISTPPAITARLDLRIIENDFYYAANFKPLVTDGHSWDLVVDRAASSTVTVSLGETGLFPEGFQRYILDLDYHYLVPISGDKFTLHFEDQEESRNLRLILGTNGYAESVNSGIPLIPIEFALNQNYPNPFNPETTIGYQIKKLTRVQLEIYNVLGQRVRTLVDRQQGAGLYDILWDGNSDNGRQVASGIYLYRLRAGDYVKSKKMVLVR